MELAAKDTVSSKSVFSNFLKLSNEGRCQKQPEMGIPKFGRGLALGQGMAGMTFDQ